MVNKIKGQNTQFIFFGNLQTNFINKNCLKVQIGKKCFPTFESAALEFGDADERSTKLSAESSAELSAELNLEPSLEPSFGPSLELNEWPVLRF